MTQPNLFEDQQQEETHAEEGAPVLPPKVKILHAPKVCANPLCKKEFTPKNSRALYCSASCNARASQIRLAEKAGIKITDQPQPEQTMQPSITPMPLAGAYGIPPHAQMMINHHENESKRWEKKYDQEVVDHKVTKQKLEDLKDTLRENEKPSGLNGFAQTAAGVEIIKAVAPALGEFALAAARKAASQQQQPQIGGPAGQTTMDAQFSKWVGGLKEETQRNLWNMINKMSEMDEERMNYVILNTMQYL